MKWMIEEYGFSIVNLVVVGLFIEMSQWLYRLFVYMMEIHMEGLIG